MSSAQAEPEKSAEVIVVGATSYAKRGGLTTSEGLNGRLFPIRQGALGRRGRHACERVDAVCASAPR